MFAHTTFVAPRRALSVPEISALMRGADSKPPSAFDRWGNDSRLQAMIVKCQGAGVCVGVA
eukprot:8646506-Lingulodinium_polyedra.AAC.1